MCVTSLLYGPRADLWPFYGFLCKRFSLYIKVYQVQALQRSGSIDPPKENGRKFAPIAPIASKFRLGNTRQFSFPFVILRQDASTESKSKVTNLCKVVSKTRHSSTEPRPELRVTVERQRHVLRLKLLILGVGDSLLLPLFCIYVNGSKGLSPTLSVSNLSLRPCRYLSTVMRSSGRGSVNGFRWESLQRFATFDSLSVEAS